MKTPSNVQYLMLTEVNLGKFYLTEQENNSKQFVLGMNITTDLEFAKIALLFKRNSNSHAELPPMDEMKHSKAIILSDEVELKVDYSVDNWEKATMTKSEDLEVIVAPVESVNTVQTVFFLAMTIIVDRSGTNMKGFVNLNTNKIHYQLPQDAVKINKWKIGFQLGDDFHTILASA